MLSESDRVLFSKRIESWVSDDSFPPKAALEQEGPLAAAPGPSCNV
jgi:hypothetical protein